VFPLQPDDVLYVHHINRLVSDVLDDRLRYALKTRDDRPVGAEVD